MVRTLLVLAWLLPYPLFGGTAADIARAVRENSFDRDECYRVRDLTVIKEDIRVYLTDGYLIFSKPVAGRRHPAPCHRLAENQVAVGQIDPDVLLDYGEVAHPIALVAVEAVLAHRACDIRGGPAKQRVGEQPCQNQKRAHHAPSLPKWDRPS